MNLLTLTTHGEIPLDLGSWWFYCIWDRKPSPATFQQGFAYVIYFPLVQLRRYYTGKCIDLIWHSLLKEKRHNVLDTHCFWKKENHYMTGAGWSDTRWGCFKNPLQKHSAPRDLFNILKSSEGCKHMGKCLGIFLVCLHGKIRQNRQSVFTLRRTSANLALEGALCNGLTPFRRQITFLVIWPWKFFLAGQEVGI